jgi:hypothetical protein
MIAESPMESRTERVVMARARRVRAWRAILSAETLAFAVALLALWGIGKEVWVARVFQNAPSIAHFSAAAHFWLAAFANTRAVVQVLMLAALAAVLYLAREIAKAIASSLPPTRVAMS